MSKEKRTMSDALFGGKGSHKGGPSYIRSMKARKRKEEIAQAKKDMADFYKNKAAKKDAKKPDVKKDSAAIRLMKRRAEKEAAKTAPTSGLKGVKLDRERDKPSKKLNTKTLSASGRAAAGRTKQSRRDLKPTVYPPRRVRSLPWSGGDDAWEKQMERGNRGSGTDKLDGGLKIPAIAKAKPAFTEVERMPTTTVAHEKRHNKKNTSTDAHEKRHRSMKAGGRVRMDGTAKPR